MNEGWGRPTSEIASRMQSAPSVASFVGENPRERYEGQRHRSTDELSPIERADAVVAGGRTKEVGRQTAKGDTRGEAFGFDP